MKKKIRDKLASMSVRRNLDERVCRIEVHGLSDVLYVVEILQLQKGIAEFRAIGTKGEDDGRFLLDISEICKMSYDDEYCRCLARYRMWTDPAWERRPEFTSFRELLEFCMHAQLPVCLLTDDWSFSDDFLVTEVDSQSVSLSELDLSGKVVSRHDLELSSVRGVWQGRPYHECLAVLMKL